MLARDDTLMLRRFTPQDAYGFHVYRSDPKLGRFQSWPKMSLERCVMFVRYMADVSPLLQPENWTQIAISGRDDTLLMGDIGMFLSEDTQEVEIGITLCQPHHGKGYGTRAMRLAIGLAFEQTSVKRIICGADRRNAPSLALIKRLGFHWTHDEEMPDPRGGPATIDHLFELRRPSAG